MPDTPVISKVKLNNIEYDIKDANARGRLDTAESKLSGIAAGATVDDHKWNDVTLTKSVTTFTSDQFIPTLNDTSATSANLIKALSAATTAYSLAQRDGNGYIIAATPSTNDSSTKVATTAFVDTAISNISIPQRYNASTNPTGYLTISDLPIYDGTVI